MVRYNTESAEIEIYNGSAWVSIVEATGFISATDAEAKMYKHNEGLSNFRVVEVKKTKVLDVIQ